MVVGPKFNPEGSKFKFVRSKFSPGGVDLQVRGVETQS
jgi:hypothetical protein